MQKNQSKPRKRKPDHNSDQQLHLPAKERIARKNTEVIVVAMIIVGILGAGITFFITGAVVQWLIAGGIIGAFIGYLFGDQIVKGLSKKA